MATREEKEDLAGLLVNLQSAVKVLNAQAPAIRDAVIRQRVEYATSLVAANLGIIKDVIGE